MARARVGGWAACCFGLALGLLMASPRIAGATLRFGDLQLSGDLSAQNLFRMRQPGDVQPVQQRNTFRLRIDYDYVHDGQAFGKFAAPSFIDTAKLYILYRGVYDSVFDWAPGGKLYDFNGKPVGDGTAANPSSLADIPANTRNSLKYENTLREAYTDVAFKTIPLSLRLGRQQIVWGETDNFRLLDRVNALDLTWHLQQETEIGHSWDQLRIPYWMIKWLYQLDQIGPISNAFLEGFWNPGDWYPNKRRFLPYSPWSLPVADPITPLFPNGLEGGTLWRQGEYSRNPMDNSQVGVRFSGMTPGSVQFTIAYFYARDNQDDGSNTAFIRADLDPVTAGQANTAGKLPAFYEVPYTHTFGASANYYDDFTGAVLKTEMVYVMGKAFNDGDAHSPVLPFALFGVSKHDMWQGMVGFDRPTWIRWLNPRATWLILGQFFWHNMISNQRSVGDHVGLVGTAGPATTPLVHKGTGLPCVGTTNPADYIGCKAVDQVRDWELLGTLAATSFYLSGTLVPTITYAVDPVNSFNMLVAWTFDYYVTNDFIFNMAQRYYINTTEKPVYETWGLAGVNRGRSETQIRLTYQF